MTSQHPLLAVSPIDGRYGSKVQDLHQYFSEAALMRYRVLIEVEWFIFIINELELVPDFSFEAEDLRFLRGIYESFDLEAAKKVKEFENTTKHDVKAVEYYLKEEIKTSKKISKYSEYIHFGCTSDDINNLSYSCMIRDFLERDFYPITGKLVEEIYEFAQKEKGSAMLSRTHGQAATPTTLGKELINFVVRLERELMILSEGNFLMGKMNGAVGNYNAHLVTFPEVDWIKASEEFIESLGLKTNLYTTQIEFYDCFADVFDGIKHVNNILIDFNRDMWSYISLGYFKQKVVKGEVGSSTMPHKVNPIHFENSEGNLGIANSLLEHLSAKLPISRFQRDLSDSTVKRNFGAVFGYCILAYKSTIRGLTRCEVDHDRLAEDLDKNWEVLAEPIQMMMRKNLVPESYEKLKEFTRGEKVSAEKFAKFIGGLKISKEDKEVLKKLRPDNYVGLAEKLVENYQLKFAGDSGGGCGPTGCSGCTGCN